MTDRPATGHEESLVEWASLTSDELATLDRELPVVVPIGLVESHGPALPLGFDNDSAEHFARTVCARTGAVLLPTLHYGFADELRDYPGTVGLSMDTVGHVIADLCEHIGQHGFYKIIFLAGHGANTRAAELGFERAWRRRPDLKVACWSWWAAADLAIHHADEVETSFALLLGSRVHLERVTDETFLKPWHRVRSRRELAPESGGVNGSPSRADAESVAPDYEQVVASLVELVSRARADVAANGTPQTGWEGAR